MSVEACQDDGAPPSGSFNCCLAALQLEGAGEDTQRGDAVGGEPDRAAVSSGLPSFYHRREKKGI